MQNKVKINQNKQHTKYRQEKRKVRRKNVADDAKQVGW